MPAKVKKPKSATHRQPTKGLDRPVGLIVRRGALRRFDSLKRKTAKLPVVIAWDRREAERRDGRESLNLSRRHAKEAGASIDERRKSERRQKPPFTWELADFVVCELPIRTGRARGRKPRKSTRKT